MFCCARFSSTSILISHCALGRWKVISEAGDESISLKNTRCPDQVEANIDQIFMESFGSLSLVTEDTVYEIKCTLPSISTDHPIAVMSVCLAVENGL
jgi:hypothetical protein